MQCRYVLMIRAVDCLLPNAGEADRKLWTVKSDGEQISAFF